MESILLSVCLRELSGGTIPAPMDPAALAQLLAAVLDPAAARPSGRLRPRVVGWPVGRLLRLRRVRRVGVVMCP
jgi:hypothetical protein